MVLQSGGMVAGYKVMVKTNTLSLKNGGVVAGFRPMFKTNIKNASNVIVIVLWTYYGIIKWWHGGRFLVIVKTDISLL